MSVREQGTMSRPTLQKRGRRDPLRGQSMVEFALCFLLFLSVMIGFGQLASAVWIKTTLRHAVREGVRYAVTGSTRPGLGHDASIREIVRENAAGLISAAEAPSMITIEYYDPQGAPTGNNDGGNTIVLSVSDFAIPVLASTTISGVPLPLTVTAEATDTLEAFPTPPAR